MFTLVNLAISLGTNVHPAESDNEGNYINLHGHTFFLVFIESLIHSFWSLEVEIDGDRLYLKIVVFEFEMHW